MGDLLQLVVSGTATGAIYALAALGFTLLWQAAGTINFAQGEFVMVPAFVMLFFMTVAGVPWRGATYGSRRAPSPSVAETDPAISARSSTAAASAADTRGPSPDR